ncbi:MAG: NTP transferase domain-containing protein [Myxococcaceae bacterium]|nr:NTP transferase domain-containing protein [Myxococcaceae bacterium]
MTGALVILAAGASARMGVPKALLDAGGVGFFARLCREGHAAGLSVLGVVGGPHESAVRAAIGTLAPLFSNPAWDRGQWSSTQVGLRAALGLAPGPVVIHPVDCPLVSSRTLAQVARGAPDGGAAVAWHGTSPGHPLALSRRAAEHLALLREETTLAAELSRLRCAKVPAGPEVLHNLNTPERYRALFGRAPQLAGGGAG